MTCRPYWERVNYDDKIVVRIVMRSAHSHISAGQRPFRPFS